MKILQLLKKSLIAVTITSALASPFVVHDLANLGKKDTWSTFDKIRVKSYLETIGFASYFVPPIGPLAGYHHVSVLGDAYIDKDLPGDFQMDFLRDAVMYAPEHGKNKSFKERFLEHENAAVESYKKTKRRSYTKDIVQPVTFYRYGIPFMDHFAVTIRTDIVNGEPKSSFIVWGLGIICDHRNESNLGPQFDIFAKPLGLKGSDMISWTNDLERTGIAKPYWIIITDTKETSKFSYDAIKMKPSQRKAAWVKEVKNLNKEGKGKSVSEMYSFFNLF